MSTAMELMGSDFSVEDNFAAGFGWYQLVGNNDGEWLSRNNTFIGTAQVPASSGIGAKIGGEVAPEHGYSVDPSQLRNEIRNVRDIDDVEIPRAGIRRGEATRTDDRGDDADEQREQPVQTDGDESIVYLSDLRWASALSGWGDVEIDTNNGERGSGDGTQMRINGKTYDKGLGVAVNSVVVYDLDGKYERFFSEVGIDDYAGEAGSMRFEVWADGKKIYDSSVMTGRMGAKALDVNVKGVRELKLITTDGADGGNSDHGNWANAQLTRA
jgi:hypothetical protein